MRGDGQIDAFRNPGSLSGIVTCPSIGDNPCDVIRAPGGTVMADIAFNPAGTLYGVSTANSLNTIALATGAATPIATLSGNNFSATSTFANALAFNDSGTLYTGTNDGNAARQAAFTVDTGTAVTTKVGAGNNTFGTNFTVTSTGTNFTAGNVTTDGDYAFAGNIMYATLLVGGAMGNSGAYLATINTGTGAATLIGKTMVGGTAINIEGLAWDPNGTGTLWGVSGDTAYTINTTTGALTTRFTVAAVGGVPANFQGAAGVVPEPASLALFGTGLAALWVLRRRRIT